MLIIHFKLFRDSTPKLPRKGMSQKKATRAVSQEEQAAAMSVRENARLRQQKRRKKIRDDPVLCAQQKSKDKINRGKADRNRNLMKVAIFTKATLPAEVDLNKRIQQDGNYSF